MHVYDRNGNYKGRAGKPVRDVRTGKIQRMGPPPKAKRGCFAALVLLAGPVALAAATVGAHVADLV